MKLKKVPFVSREDGSPRTENREYCRFNQSTTFRYETSEEMGKLFDLEKEGYF